MTDVLNHDSDPKETNEWLEAFNDVLTEAGSERASFLLNQLLLQASSHNVQGYVGFNTPYQNSIPEDQEEDYPGNLDLENKIQALIRWNAVAMVLRAGKKAPELGGHLATYASAATLYEMGFNHFYHAPTGNHGGDLVFFQGHASPGMYARAYLEGRFSDEQLANFRQEIEKNGLSSYPHPWLMPNFWQFATVSMGLGPLQAIYQARFLKYLQNRELCNTENRKVWCYCGDGEMDEPESLGAITLAGREQLDNLIFVINCNLQRLDGPVRGNSKIIQELESVFLGAGWRVIKVIWSSEWDELFARDKTDLLLKRMQECVDGEYQNFAGKDGAYFREHFFGKYPELLELVSDKSDEELMCLKRGGHDPIKVYNAYKQAVEHKGQPVLILPKTVKGYGMGKAGEAQNKTHQQKKMNEEQLKYFRDRFHIPISDEQIAEIPFYRPKEDSEEIQYLLKQRENLGGFYPIRNNSSTMLPIPSLEHFKPLLEDSGEREISTTMAFVRILNILLKDKNLAPYIIPIVPDESRTFGMEGLFRQVGIYAPFGQKYTPEDRDQVMYYREDPHGQMLQEGINEAGAFCSWIAAATSYSVNQLPLIPFYIYYSMFGFQRIGDLAWAAGDMQARGFLLGATSGRTTLAGEGLQHQDGHSHILAGTIPNCISYDPTYAYELAVIIREGMKRMYEKHENVYYYITLLNENYTHRAMPEDAEDGILKGLYLLQEETQGKHSIQLIGSGSILREVEKAANILKQDYDVAANVWSATSFNELAREGQKVDRWNRLHPESIPHKAYVTQCLEKYSGPVIAATDYMKAYAEQIRLFVPHDYTVLGTDGFGRSDTRAALRHFFEVDHRYIVIASLAALARQGAITANTVQHAIVEFGINPEKADPLSI